MNGISTNLLGRLCRLSVSGIDAHGYREGDDDVFEIVAVVPAPEHADHVEMIIRERGDGVLLCVCLRHVAEVGGVIDKG